MRHATTCGREFFPNALGENNDDDDDDYDRGGKRRMEKEESFLLGKNSFVFSSLKSKKYL